MRVTLIEVPYHLGVEDSGYGKAPRMYLDAGAERLIREAGNDVEITRVRRETPYGDELAAVLNVNAALAVEVRQAVARNRLPVVLAGDCNAALGVMAGTGTRSTAVLWFDAHGDFNTPETSPSGYLDGMPLALATGRCLRDRVWGRLGGACVPEDHVVHIGGRDFDREEEQSLSRSRVRVISASELTREGPEDALWPLLQTLMRAQSGRRPDELGAMADAYLHLDVDVLSPDEAPAVGYPAPGGLGRDQRLDAFADGGRARRVSAVTLAGLDPDAPDPEGRTVSAGLAALCAAVAAAAGRGRP